MGRSNPTGKALASIRIPTQISAEVAAGQRAMAKTVSSGLAQGETAAMQLGRVVPNATVLRLSVTISTPVASRELAQRYVKGKTARRKW